MTSGVVINATSEKPYVRFPVESNQRPKLVGFFGFPISTRF